MYFGSMTASQINQRIRPNTWQYTLLRNLLNITFKGMYIKCILCSIICNVWYVYILYMNQKDSTGYSAETTTISDWFTAVHCTTEAWTLYRTILNYCATFSLVHEQFFAWHCSWALNKLENFCAEFVALTNSLIRILLSWGTEKSTHSLHKI